MNNEDIKPCPFCGQQPIFRPGSSDYGRVGIVCSCKIRPGIVQYIPDSEALELWNNRPVEETLHDEVSQLTDELENARDYRNSELGTGMLTAMNNMNAAAVGELKTENARLRAALEKIAENKNPAYGMVAIARAALNPVEEQ